MANGNGKTQRFPVLGGNDMVDLHAMRRRFSEDGIPVTQMMHSKLIPDDRARFAMVCVERWAMIAGEADGEDSAGRQKARRMTPAELVDHACSVASAAYDEFTKRGWLIASPSYQEMIDAVKDTENGND
jgi:hypothetical protein